LFFAPNPFSGEFYMCTAEDPCRLLIIEDDEFLIRLLEAKNQQGQFMDYSLSCSIAKTLKEGITAIRNADRPFDVISLDPKLPDSEGFKTFAAIHAVLPNTPTFIYTGYTDTSILDVMVQQGAEHYFFKADWTIDQYLTLLHYGAGQGRARAKRRQESEQRLIDAQFYKARWEEATAQIENLRSKIPDSEASKELEQIIGKMKLAVAS
jgi:ActR/RegA family two-component response regulator